MSVRATFSPCPIAFVAVAAAALVLALLGCSNRSSGGASGVTDLGKVEVRDYQGKKLSSVLAEPENSIKGPQHIDPATYRLRIYGEVASATALTYPQITSMHSAKKVVDLNCVEGWTVTYLWQGVLLADLLQKAGGANPSAKVLIFHCVDGYTTSLPLDYVVSRNILLGYKMNDVTMPAERGYPFQVIAEDKFGYKWAKWVDGIEVSSDASYLGYWEKRGYDNNGALPGAPSP
jgi:DMSO/TMAO reductase YedYZ molybdopterin-dependent catalytic subunit